MGDGDSGVHLSRLRDAVIGCDLDNIESIAVAALNSKVDPLKAIQEGLAGGIRVVGERYSKGEAYLPELVMAANVMKKGVAVFEPHISEGADRGGLGKVVLGTVEGDIHDIGKSLVGTLFGTAGFEVIDLGVDVANQKFVDSTQKEQAVILGMSALMTTTMVSMTDVLAALADKGIRGKVKVMVGGAPTTKEWAKEIGADAQAGDAVEALSLAKSMLSKR